MVFVVHGINQLTGRYNSCYTGDMKTAISIPDTIFEAAEQLAKRMGMSRSELYVAALTQYVDKHQEQLIMEQLNAVYTDTDSSLDPVLVELQRRTLAHSGD